MQVANLSNFGFLILEAEIMASSKLSDLTALTSVGDDDLVYIADTADKGSTYASKKVTKANLFSGYTTESMLCRLCTHNQQCLSTELSPVSDALNTLNEIAAEMLNDDAFCPFSMHLRH